MTNTIRSLIRPAVTLALTVTFCALVIAGRPVPEVFTTVLSMVLGWWFSSRSEKGGGS